MLKCRDDRGIVHVIAHLRHDNIALLVALKQRFNGELAILSMTTRSWVPLASLDVENARETDVVIESSPP